MNYRHKSSPIRLSSDAPVTLFELYESVSQGQTALKSLLIRLFSCLSITLEEKAKGACLNASLINKAGHQEDLLWSSLNASLHRSESSAFLCIQITKEASLLLCADFESAEQCSFNMRQEHVSELLPHIVQSIEMSYTINRQQHDLQSIQFVLDHYPLPALAVDQNFHTIFANKAIRHKLGHLNTACNAQNSKTLQQSARENIDILKLPAIEKERSDLRAALQRCTHIDSQTTNFCTITIDTDQYPVVIASTDSVPNVFRHYAREGIAWVYVLDVNYGKQLKSNPSFMSLHLSSAEKELCVLLFEGRKLNDIATKRNVSQETVRKQLQSVLRKTELESQESLIIFLFENCIQHGLLPHSQGWNDD